MSDDWSRKADIREEQDMVEAKKSQGLPNDTSAINSVKQKPSGPYPTSTYEPNTSVVG